MRYMIRLAVETLGTVDVILEAADPMHAECYALELATGEHQVDAAATEEPVEFEDLDRV